MSEMTTMNDENSFFVLPVDTTAGYLYESWPSFGNDTVMDAIVNAAAQCGRPINQFHWTEETPTDVRIWMYPEFWPTSDDDV